MHFDSRTQRAFFADDGPYDSDMELAHSAAEIREHATAEVDLFTRGSDLRGYLSLGETVHDRVRFARDPEEL